MFFVQSTTDPIHRISILLKSTTLRKKKKSFTSIQSENPGKQESIICPKNDSQTVDQKTIAVRQGLGCGELWGLGCLLLLLGLRFFGRSVADELEGAHLL